MVPHPGLKSRLKEKILPIKTCASLDTQPCHLIVSLVPELQTGDIVSVICFRSSVAVGPGAAGPAVEVFQLLPVADSQVPHMRDLSCRE